MRTVAEYMEALTKAVTGGCLEDHVTTFMRLITEADRVFICGNGGSAATASHMACDLAKTTKKRINAIALTDNMSLMTAIGNDLSYDEVFREQLIHHTVNSRDLLIAISASGNSANVVQAVKYAREQGANAIGLLGFNGGIVRPLVNYICIVHSNDYGVTEDAHAIIMHILTERLKAL